MYVEIKNSSSLTKSESGIYLITIVLHADTLYLNPIRDNIVLRDITCKLVKLVER